MACTAYPVNRNGYLILQQMNSGDSSIVYKAICSNLNSVVAINAFDRDITKQTEENTDLCSWTFRHVSHTHLLTPLCSFRVDEKIWVVMPFKSHGSLHSIISYSFPKGLPEIYISVILKETLHALSYLHTIGFIHGDINARNIFFDDSNGSVQLAYFGESAAHYQEKRMPYWIAPEDKHLTVDQRLMSHKTASDIWLFGITALELVHGSPPLSHRHLSRADISTEKVSEAFKDLVVSCLAEDESKRPTAKALLDHPFFKDSLSSDFLLEYMLLGRVLDIKKMRREDKDDEGTSETIEDDGTSLPAKITG